jgi:hypothetical protein
VDLKSKWAHSSENVVSLLCTEKPFSVVLIDAILYGSEDDISHKDSFNFVEFFSPVPETFCHNNFITFNELVDGKVHDFREVGYINALLFKNWIYILSKKCHIIFLHKSMS